METILKQPEEVRAPRRDPKAIAALLEDYRQSGLSQTTFARERGLNVGTFRGWLYKSRKHPIDGLREVALLPESVRTDKAAALIRLANGSEVELPLSAGLAWVERMIRELSQA